MVYFWNLDMFKYSTAAAVWCEPKFVHSPWIAETYNTISNIPYLVFTITALIKSRSYMRRCDHKLKWLIYGLFLIGVGSAYFHGTLSMAGQLVDELGILWVCTLCCAWYFPTQVLPRLCFKGGYSEDEVKHLIGHVAFASAIASTLLCQLFPAGNCVVLFLIALPWQAALLVVFCVHERSTTLNSVYISYLMATVVSLFCWVMDFAFCPLATAMGFPYFHALWHVASAYAGAYLISVLSFCHHPSFKGEPMSSSMCDLIVQLRRCPEWAGYFGVPYLVLLTEESVKPKQRPSSV